MDGQVIGECADKCLVTILSKMKKHWFAVFANFSHPSQFQATDRRCAWKRCTVSSPRLPEPPQHTTEDQWMPRVEELM